MFCLRFYCDVTIIVRTLRISNITTSHADDADQRDLSFLMRISSSINQHHGKFISLLSITTVSNNNNYFEAIKLSSNSNTDYYFVIIFKLNNFTGEHFQYVYLSYLGTGWNEDTPRNISLSRYFLVCLTVKTLMMAIQEILPPINMATWLFIISSNWLYSS